MKYINYNFTFFRLLAAGIILSLSSCDKSPEKTTQSSSKDNVLNIYNWAGNMDPKILKQFEDETGIKVNYNILESDEVLEAKLLSGPSEYDLVVPSLIPYFSRQVELGHFKPLDKSLLPNWGNLDKKILKSMEVIDPNNKYGMPYMWGTTGFGYNVKKIQKIFPYGCPIDSLQMIFDPNIIEKLHKNGGVILVDYGPDLFDAALRYLGISSCTNKECFVEAANLINKVRPFIKGFSSSSGRLVRDLLEDNVVLVYGWSGEMMRINEEAKALNKKISIEYSIPKEGPGIWIDVMAIPRAAPHPENAHKFLNYLLRPHVAAQLTAYLMQATPNKASHALLPKSLQNNHMLFQSTSILENWTTAKPLPLNLERIRSRLWTRIKMSL